MRKLLIATRNKGKIKEIKKILSGIPFELKTLEETGAIDEVPETGKSFKENAVIKAEMIGEITRLLTLAEDSGLEVDVLGGRPGVLSARYSKGSDTDRIYGLLKELKGVSQEKRTARFRSVVAVFDPRTDKTHSFEGASEGYITDKPMGKNGFGYDPIFFNFDLGKTNAQATLEGKNQVSHRARALLKVKSLLQKFV